MFQKNTHLFYSILRNLAELGFKGKITYSSELRFILESDKPLPPLLSELERLTTITYFIHSDSEFYTISQHFGDTLSISKKSRSGSVAYFNRSGSYMDFSALKKGGDVITVRKSKNRKKEINGFDCRLYQDKTNKNDITDIWLTKDFPYQFPFDLETAKTLGFPLAKEGLKISSHTFSEITDDLSWVIDRELVGYEWNDTFQISFPESFEKEDFEIYEPVEIVEKDIVLIDEEFREYAHIEAWNTEGRNVSTDSLRGSYTYIDLWATWCRPCVESLPFLANIYEKYSKEGLQIVSISLDGWPHTDKWKSVSEKENIYWMNWNMPEGFDSSICRQLGVKAIPHYILLDAEGRIVLKNAPAPSDPSLVKLLDSLLVE